MTESLPTGLLTFLFTDIEGSTDRWEVNAPQMAAALAHHDQVLRHAIEASDGHIFKHTGDGFAAVFQSPQRAVEAAVAGQLALQAADWGPAERLKVRMGAHLGEAVASNGDYFGPPVNRAARVMDIANGDQIAVSEALVGLVQGITLNSAGTHVLKGIGSEHVHFVSDDRLTADDRAPRSRVSQMGSPLPSQLGRLIGRNEEVATALSLFDTHRMVTIVGPGGVGKSRLAFEIGHWLTEAAPEGIVLCELAPVGVDDAVESVVAEAVGARIQPGMTLVESIASYLESKHVLIIFDNCEHVSAAAREVIAAILGVEGPLILATSRESVGLPGEQLFGLNPLDPTTFGVDLFIQRAQERDVSFDASGAQRAVVEEICRRLDGMPLAIELAAAWVRVLTPEELVEKLDDRFRVLRGGRRGGRHETLRDTIRWSYEQLDDDQAALFDRLSVFAGGFTLDAVGAVCFDGEDDGIATLETLMALVDKSMVMTQRGVGRIRFTMLETLRQFGQEQLDQSGDSETLFRRHADHYAGMVEVDCGQLLSSKEAEIWDHLDREWSNIRAAFDTILVHGELDKAATLILDLGHYASLAMRFELFEWLDDLAAEPLEDRADAGALFGLQAMRSYLTVLPGLVTFAQRGLELDPVDHYGFCRLALAAEYLNNVHDPTESGAVTRDWLEHLDDSILPAVVWARAMRTFQLALYEPSEQEAAVQARRLREIAHRTESATVSALASWAEGLVAAIDDREQAIQIWDVGLDRARSVHQVHLVVHLIVGLIIHFNAGTGDLLDVLRRSRAIIAEALEQHYLAGSSHLLGVVAIVLARAGEPEQGARLLGAMEANGHLPRTNATRAIEAALGDATESAKAAGIHLSTSEAAADAVAALDKAIAAAGDRGADQ